MAFDVVQFTDQYKSQFYSFYLDPDGWRKFSTPHSLNWQKVRFEESNRTNIPAQRGIYAFTLEHSPSKFPGHGYILYAGISGHTSQSNLRRRYGQYLENQRTGKGRWHITYMLKKWPSDLFFYFCPLADKSINLKELETILLGAINPPVNRADFPANISAARKAKF